MAGRDETLDRNDIAVAVPAHVVSRPFPNETVVLNLHTGQYHGLNTSAGEVLRALEQAGTVRRAADLLAGRWDVPRDTLESDIRELISGLAERGLLEILALP